jgi:hypothetical protein
MRVGIADQLVEHEHSLEAQCLGRGLSRRLPDQMEALTDAGATLFLILELRGHAQRLAEVFLVKPLNPPITKEPKS